MSSIPDDCLYTEEHEWLRREGDAAVVGITQHAAEQLGDLTYVNAPAVGQRVTQGHPLGEVESVKAVSDVYAPASGEVIEVNERLEAEPGLVNADPYGEGWICKLKLSMAAELNGLLDAARYAQLLADERH